MPPWPPAAGSPALSPGYSSRRNRPTGVLRKLIESGDAFIVLPGGIGTLEELADTFSHYRIYAAPGSRPPILIANINGIYDPLKALFQNWLRLGFIEKEDLSSIHFCSSLEEIMKILGK